MSINFNQKQKDAKILVEALPYMQKYHGKTVVIKYGGHAMADDELKKSFARDISLLKHIGINPIVVHGGGPQINKSLTRIGVKSSFYKGMRITDKDTIEIVEMVLCGNVNKEIVSLIGHYSGKAIGLSGKDANLFKARKMYIDGIDIGYVGYVTNVNRAILDSLSDFIPVIAPIGMCSEGETYNINADLVAGSIASELKAEKLLLLTDVEGVLDKNGKKISSIAYSTIYSMLHDGTISGGMIPKLKGAIDAIKSGVSKVHIIDGRVKHSILLELFTDTGIGTEIVNV